MTSKYESTGFDGFRGNIPVKRLSYYDKKKNNFKWVEDCADFYDYFYGSFTNKEKIDRANMNYELYNGRGKAAFSEYAQTAGLDLAEEGIAHSFADIPHHDIISNIAKAMVGEVEKRPLAAMAIDKSGLSLNQRKRKRTELMQAYIQETIVQPLSMQAVQQYMEEFGITDLYSLSPEQQQQMQADVEQRQKAMTPKEIESYMRKEYKSPVEQQAQQLLTWILEEYDFKFMSDQNFKNAVIFGSEIYYLNYTGGKIQFENVNPKYFEYSASAQSFWIQDAEWAKYERITKVSEIFNKHGAVITNADLKKFDNIFNSGSATDPRSGYRALADSNLVSVISTQGNIEESPDIRSRQGQEYMKSLYEKYGTLHGSMASVREVNIVYRALRKLKNITRVQDGKMKKFWVDESYEMNPSKGDVSQKECWVPEVWTVDKIGATEAIYINKQPVPFQYKSLEDPFDVKLPYFGAEYGRMFDNAKNVSPIDLGKPWQYKYNVQMARIQEMEATDIGKVLLTTLSSKPKDWSWGKFLSMLRYGKLGVLDTTQEAVQNIDLQAIKQVDLGNMYDIASRLQYLEILERRAALAMSYNPSRLGEVSPYTSVRNNQQNIIQSSHQTEDIYTIHNKIVEHVLNAFIDVARLYAKDHPIQMSYMLSDMSIAELNIDWEMISRAKLAVYVRNSTEDFQNIELVKQQLQPMVQNGLISMPEMIKLTWAKTYSEVLNISEEAQEKADKMRQEAMQAEQEQMLRAEQLQRDLAKAQEDFQLLLQERDLLAKKYMSDNEIRQFAAQYDINSNQINDGIEKNREDLKFKREELDKKVQLEKDKIASNEKIKKMEINQKAKEKKQTPKK